MANQEFTNVACGDNYTDAATIRDVFKSSGGVFQVADQPATYKLQFGGLGQDYWTPEATIGTGGGSIPPGVIGVAFRNASPGVVATVSALIRPKEQPHLALTFGGASSVSTIPRVTSLPASPSDTQIIAFVPDSVNFPGVEWLLIFNASANAWDFLGGGSLVRQSGVLVNNTGVGVWEEISAACRITLARAGTYNVLHSALLYKTNVAAAEIQTSIAKTGAPPVLYAGVGVIDNYSGAAADQFEAGAANGQIVVVAGDTVTIAVRSFISIASQVQTRALEITPVRIT